MAHAERRGTALVLDLDDTLYKEADYRASGLREVCRWVQALYGKPVDADLAALRGMGSDALAAICQMAGLPATAKESLLWVYRLHLPAIALTPATRGFLAQVAPCCHLAVLTDGRSVSQRQKLRALGLEHLPAYISEDYGSEKPAPFRFELIMQDLPADRYVYVGDNPAKDFVAPNRLGWETIGLKGDACNVHSQACAGLGSEQLPHRWVDSLDELLDGLARDGAGLRGAEAAAGKPPRDAANTVGSLG